MAKKTEATKEEVIQKINSVPVFFQWKSLQPDARQYKPGNPLLEPSRPINIRVDVPLDKALIHNADKISIAQLSSQSAEEPQLTPLGMRYIVDQFEAAMSPAKEESPEKADDEDWDEKDQATEKASPKSADEDEWEDEVKTSDSKDEEKADFDNDDEWND